MEKFGTLYKTKIIKALGVHVAVITSHYQTLPDGGYKGCIIISPVVDNDNVVTLHTCVITGENATLEKCKDLLNTVFNSIELDTKRELPSDIKVIPRNF